MNDLHERLIDGRQELREGIAQKMRIDSILRHLALDSR